MSKAWLSLRALQAQSSVWPQTVRRAPATSALHHHHNAHLQTSSRHDRHGAGQSCTQHSNSETTARDGWRWQTHSFMLFLSFEIAIKADQIKPVCVIEVFRETLTGSRYSRVLCKRFTRSTRNFGIRGETWQRLLQTTLTRRQLPVCPDVAWMHIGNNHAYIRALCALILKQLCICHCPGLHLFV